MQGCCKQNERYYLSDNEKLNIKGNTLIEAPDSHTNGAFKIEPYTQQDDQGSYHDNLKISYNNSTSFVAIGGSGSLWLYHKGLSISDGEITINDANDNRNIYIHEDGRIYAKKLLLAETEDWPDYIFEDNYKLQSLPELENYLKINKHLPDLPPAKDVEAKGIDVGAVNTQLVKKVEELTLYLIEQNKQNEAQQKQIENQQKQIEELMKKVNK